MEALRAVPHEAHYVRVEPGQVLASLGEGQISVAFESNGEGSEPYAVDGKIIRIARAMASDAIVTGSVSKLRLTGAGGAYSFGRLTAELVPLVAQPDERAPIAVEPSALKNAISYVRAAAAVNDTWPLSPG